VGGQLIPDSEARYVFGKWWTESSYLYDPITSTSNAYVYIWSFSSNPNLSSKHGIFGNSHTFTGTEQIQINFLTTLSASYNISIYAQQENTLNISSGAVSTNLLPPSNA
jgi:hypothetical protein